MVHAVRQGARSEIFYSRNTTKTNSSEHEKENREVKMEKVEVVERDAHGNQGLVGAFARAGHGLWKQVLSTNSVE